MTGLVVRTDTPQGVHVGSRTGGTDREWTHKSYLTECHVRVSKQSCKQTNHLIWWGRWNTKKFSHSHTKQCTTISVRHHVELKSLPTVSLPRIGCVWYSGSVRYTPIIWSWKRSHETCRGWTVKKKQRTWLEVRGRSVGMGRVWVWRMYVKVLWYDVVCSRKTVHHLWRTTTFRSFRNVSTQGVVHYKK